MQCVWGVMLILSPWWSQPSPAPHTFFFWPHPPVEFPGPGIKTLPQ